MKKVIMQHECYKSNKLLIFYLQNGTALTLWGHLKGKLLNRCNPVLFTTFMIVSIK